MSASATLQGVNETVETTGEERSRRARALARVRAELRARLTPEHTRDATLTERLTVSRLSWNSCVRLNRYLEFFGRLATLIYCAFMVTVVFGVNWRAVVESSFNSGKPVRGAIILVFVLPTLFFVALRSMTGWGRWRVQRELWRRDVAILTGSGDAEAAGHSGPGSHFRPPDDRP